MDHDEITHDPHMFPAEAHDLARQEAQFFLAWGQMRQQGVQSFSIIGEYGMSVTQFNILGLLEHMDGAMPCTIRWLSHQMRLDPATIVRAVDHLEQRGVIARRRDTRDRRQVFVELTDHGRALQQALHQRAMLRLILVFRSMSDEGRQSLLQGLHHFLTQARSFDEREAERAPPGATA